MRVKSHIAAKIAPLEPRESCLPGVSHEIRHQVRNRPRGFSFHSRKTETGLLVHRKASVLTLLSHTTSLFRQCSTLSARLRTFQPPG